MELTIQHLMNLIREAKLRGIKKIASEGNGSERKEMFAHGKEIREKYLHRTNRILRCFVILL